MADYFRVTPDIPTPAAQARDRAHRLALEQVITADGPQAAEAGQR